jgi:hypothetical protein
LLIKDKDLIPALKNNCANISEYCFANIFLFRDVHNYKLITFNNRYWITGTTRKNIEYVMPTSDPCLIPIKEYFEIAEKFKNIYPLPEKIIHEFTDKFSISHDRNESDYIHSVSSLNNYPGKAMHKKKNLLNQFYKFYSHRQAEISNLNIKDLLFILDYWQSNAKEDKFDTDYNSAKEAILQFEELDLTGWIFYVDDNPAGYAIGEALNDEMFVLHFVKGLTQFKGIYQFIFSSVAANIADKYSCINLEQDLGIPELRHSKKSYNPDFFINKFMVSLN